MKTGTNKIAPITDVKVSYTKGTGAANLKVHSKQLWVWKNSKCLIAKEISMHISTTILHPGTPAPARGSLNITGVYEQYLQLLIDPISF